MGNSGSVGRSLTVSILGLFLFLPSLPVSPADAENTCVAGSEPIYNPFDNLRLNLIRLSIGCYAHSPVNTNSTVQITHLSASLHLKPAAAAPGLQASRLPPTPEALAVEARIALGALRANHGDRLRRLSLGGLPLGDRIPDLLPALLELRGLFRLNLSDTGISHLPVGLLGLPRLLRIEAGGNPLDCGRQENRWARLLSRMGSDLLAPAGLLLCPDYLNATSQGSNATNASIIDAIDPEPEHHQVDLHGSLRVPCSERYFRAGDAGLWSADTLVVWRRLGKDSDGEGISFLLLAGNGTNSSSSSSSGRVVVYRPSALRFVSRMTVGPIEESAPLMISGLRQAVVGYWHCEVTKEDDGGGLRQVAARHRLVLRPPLAGVEIACYIVAVSTNVIMILIGLLAALLRGMIRTRCWRRKVHIVEAQSVLHLDASPQQARRWRQPAASAAAADTGIFGDSGDGGGNTLAAAIMIGEDLLIDGELAGPSGSAAASAIVPGWRDRLRGINDQMRLHVGSVGSSMRAGWSSGVEHVKEQMRSVAEFCGTNTPLGQTVSIVSIYTDPEGRQEPLELHLHLLSSV